MSKPKDIPQDVWNSTTETFDQMLGCSGYPGARDDSIAVLARAIMAAKKEERNQIFSKVLANPSSVVLDAMAAERSDQIKRNGHGEWGFRDIWLAGVRAVGGEA